MNVEVRCFKKITPKGSFRVILRQREIQTALIVTQQRLVIGQDLGKETEDDQHRKITMTKPQAVLAPPSSKTGLTGDDCGRISMGLIEL
jgi:hypothetical protein